MKLELSGTEITQALDKALLETSLHSLSGDDDSFLILSKDDMSYIQTCRSSDGSFVLEYQEGSLEQHYECADDMLNHQKILLAFSSYLEGSDKWKTEFTWEPLGSSSASDGSSRPIKLLVLTVIAVLAVATLLIVSL